MKQGIFCIVSPIREGGALATSMTEAEKRLTKAGIPFSRPKIGRHITFVPPFKASELEMRWLAAGLESAQTFYSEQGEQRMVQGTSVDFFEGEPEALVIRLGTHDSLKNFVERFRSKIPEHTEWLYPPENYLVNFHATIAEADDLSQSIEKEGGVPTLFRGIKFNQPAPLQPPLLFEKLQGSWRPWRL